ncbi:MAG: efflux RND transporter permease subunit [Armatimonadetes bacterium]|nr:efflux RND transporter permease subunit [Armatimonadota bacterium]
MWLTNVSIRRPIFIIMFVLALIVLGLQSHKKMPKELNPKIDFPYVTVVTMYPGAGPNEIETLVSEPIEKAVGSINNLRNVTSSSQDGVSMVSMEFELGTDLNAAAADIRDKVSATKGTLPKDIEEPTILKLDIASLPVLTIGMSGPLSPKEMRILADDVVVDRLAKVGGVASVNATGGEEREISVAVNKGRLQAYGIGMPAVVTAIRGSTLNLPAGSIKEGARNTAVRTVGEFVRADEIRDVRINIAGKNSKPDTYVRLGDVATITDTVAEPERISRLDGKPTVVLTVQKQSDANTVDVSEGVLEQIEEMKPVMPPGVSAVIIEDNAEFVIDALDDVNRSLFEGIFLVVVIVLLFLHTARATFIVAIAIPTSILATFMPISSFGFTLNQMTMLALSLVVGILVDDSIVVLENIERHLRMRENPTEAAINGRSEIGLAAITITMVDIVVFVPVAFMGGIVGQFFRQFGITVAVATAFSLLMSFTLTPMLASRWMKSEEHKEREDIDTDRRVAEGRPTLKDWLDIGAGRVFGVLEGFLKRLDHGYRGVLEWALHNRFLTVIIGFLSLLVVFIMVVPLPEKGAPGPAAIKMLFPRIFIALIALVLAGLAMLIDRKSKFIALGFGVVIAYLAMTIYLPFGFTMMPVTDNGSFTINVRTAPGTSLEATTKVVKEVEALIKVLPEIKPVEKWVSDAVWYKPLTWVKRHKVVEKGYYVSYIGAATSGIMGADMGSQYARIDAKVVRKALRKRSMDDIVADISQKIALIPGAEQISVAASSHMGPGSGVMMEVQGQNMDAILEQARRLKDIILKTPGATDVDISYKESKPESRIEVDKLRAAELGMTLAQVATAARTAIAGDDTAKLREGGTEYPIRVWFEKDERSHSSDIENLIIGAKGGAPIYLRDVATVKTDNAPSKIERKNRQRVVYVTANLEKGAQLGNVDQAIQAAMKKSQKVPGITIATGGVGKIMYESIGFMISALLLAVLLVYMLMGALFESFLTPLVIMFSLPQAMVGALLALLVTGNVMSIFAMIGIIMLMGLVTKNAILLVDYTNTLRERGRNRHDALLEAGPTRLRPILMTTLAMVGGMLPTAMALNQGSESRAPMAIAVIGGLIMSTMLTLIVIPVWYTLVDDVWHWIMRTFFRSSHSRIEDKSASAIDQSDPLATCGDRE